jgi:1-acyl-sn-glycerol-3-phosphate acyltransferase
MSKPTSTTDTPLELKFDLPYIKTKNPILKAFLFFISILVNAWCMFYVVLYGFLLSPIRLINVSLYQKLESYAWIHGAKLYTFMSNMLVGVPTTIYGDYKGGFSHGRKILVSNHCSSADWLIQLAFAGRNSEGALRFFLKKAHKYVPLAGWACQLHG